jgi:hypothetical protein
MMDQCGRCHEDFAKTFFETYHGKVTQLGSEGAAKCYDCHGTHNILPTDNPESSLSHWKRVETCGKCHPMAHRQFAGYLTHATHHDKDKQLPVLVLVHDHPAGRTLHSRSPHLLPGCGGCCALRISGCRTGGRRTAYRRFTSTQRSCARVMILTSSRSP